MSADALIWCDGGDVSYITSVDGDVKSVIGEELIGAIPPDFSFVNCGNGRYAILYTSQGDNGTEIYTLYNDGNKWGQPLAVTKTDGYICNYDVLYSGGEFLVPMTSKDVTFSGDSFDGKTRFDIASYTPVDSYSFTIKSIDQNTGEVVTEVKNSGIKAVNNLRFSVSKSSDTVANNAGSFNIESGETREIAFNLTMPKVNTDDYTFKLYNDDNPNGVEKTHPLYYTDIEVKAKQIGSSSGVRMVEVTVKNNGAIKSNYIEELSITANEKTFQRAITDTATQVTVSEESEEGETMTDVSVSREYISLEKGQSITYLYDVGVETEIMSEMAKGDNKVTFAVEQESDKLQENNSSEVIMLTFDENESLDSPFDNPQLQLSQATYDKHRPTVISVPMTYGTKTSFSSVKYVENGVTHNVTFTISGKVVTIGQNPTNGCVLQEDRYQLHQPQKL